MTITCPACHGRGLIHWHPHWDNGHGTCTTCAGTGKIEEKMKNKLSDLNDHLFAQLERLSNEDLSPEQIATEVKRAEAIVSVSDQIVGNADLQLQAAKLFAQHGGSVLSMLPQIGGPK